MIAIVIFFGARRGIRLPAGPSAGRFDDAGLPEPINRGRFTAKHGAIRGMPAK
jgi:hypothetical protein